MKIALYTDCMPINFEVDETGRYPALLQAAFPFSDIKNISLSGMTTIESVDNVMQILEGKPDLAVYAFGVNDAIPRGLKRTTRGAIIRWSYRIKMTKNMRLWYRTFFLNPLEYAMQIVGKPKQYVSMDETICNIDKCMKLFHEHGIKTVLINIAPITNYRFINANYYIKLYNQAIEKYCKQNDIMYVDAFGIFCEMGMEQALGKDKFHYSGKGHRAVADKLIEIIKRLKES